MSEEGKPILVNGEEVLQGLIDQELQMLRERYSREMSWQELDEKQQQVESDARENAVERLLLMQQARVEIDRVRPEEIEARFIALLQQHGGEEEFFQRFELEEGDLEKIKADIEDSVRLEKYFDALCAGVARPGEEDSRGYYDAHPDEFKTPELVHAAHIVQHPAQDLAPEKIYADLLNIRERLLAGEDFDALAQEFSHCDDGGQDLGFFARGQMVPRFEEVAFKTPVGEISDVFQTEFGYHVLKVLERKEETMRDFAEVRYDIESMLFDERKNEAIGTVVDGLRESAEIRNLEVFKQEETA